MAIKYSGKIDRRVPPSSSVSRLKKVSLDQTTSGPGTSPNARSHSYKARVAKETTQNNTFMSRIAKQSSPSPVKTANVSKDRATASKAAATSTFKAPDTSSMSFGDAFRAARKKGAGTKFTYKGKVFSAVTKEDLKSSKSSNLREHLNKKK